MGCTAIRKEKSLVSVETLIPTTEVTKSYPRMARMIKIFNWKSSLAKIIEVKSSLEYSSSIE